MFDLKKYKFEFDIWGFVLFLVIMIPNFIWFKIPASNDILRTESVSLFVFCYILPDGQCTIWDLQILL